VPLYIHQEPAFPGVLNAALLVLAFAVLVALGGEIARRLEPGSPRRLAVLIGATLWMTSLVAITEGLSLVHALAPIPSAGGWTLATVAGAVGRWIIRNRSRGVETERSARRPRPGWILPGVMVTAATIQAAWIAITAYTYAPNNYDALTYHLPRVLHWVQQASSGPFATNTERQVQYPPGAEYVVTQLHFVLPDDSLANHVEWAGMLLAALAVTEIARRLGACGVAQLGAALLAMALPIGIAEAATTQNDFVFAGWLAVFVAFGLGLAANPASRAWGLLAGLALGLAVLTKSTAYLYAPPLLLLMGGLALARSRPLRAVMVPVTLAAIATLALNLGQYVRVFRTYHSPLGPTGCCTNEVHTPAAFLSSLLRNFALQVPMGGPLLPVGRALQDGLAWLHALTGFDPVDPRLTTAGASDVFKQTFWFGPDFAGNLLQTLLILATIAWVTWSGADRVAKLYTAALVGCFLLFSAYLKFQIWGNRLELPLLVLWSPAITTVLFRRTVLLAGMVPLAVLIAGFDWTAHSQDAAPGYGLDLSRTEYYAAQPAQPEFAAYRTFTEAIRATDCASIGLSFAGDNLAEYPLWVMLGERGFEGLIEHVDVTNPTRRWAAPGFHACAIIADHDDPRYDTSSWRRIDDHGLYLYLQK